MKFKVVGRNPQSVVVDGKQYDVDSSRIVKIDGIVSDKTMRHLLDMGWRPADDGAVKFVRDVPGCSEILDRELQVERQRREALAAADSDTLASGGNAAMEARIKSLEEELEASKKASQGSKKKD